MSFEETTPEQDPRYEWTEVFRLGSPGSSFVRGPCKHLETVRVESVTGEVVAHLCLTCDQQLPEEWKP